MTCTELQQEELEVLRSIYDGDEHFTELSETSFQYMIGEKGDFKSFLVEISWHEAYPNEKPSISLDAFYNKHVLQDVKDLIINTFLNEAEKEIGTPMTFTLLEWLKESSATLTAAQPEIILAQSIEKTETQETTLPTTTGALLKQPKLSKQQKKKLANRVDAKGELPRGWNWVDVVKHLSQTSSQSSDAAAVSNS